MNHIQNHKQRIKFLLNDNAFDYGFGIRIGKVRKTKDKKTITKRTFLRNKNVLKRNKKGIGNKFNKVDTRTNCKALVKLSVQPNGSLKVINYTMVHNHDMVLVHLLYLIRSQKKVGRQTLATISTLQSSCIGLQLRFACLQRRQVVKRI